MKPKYQTLKKISLNKYFVTNNLGLLNKLTEKNAEDETVYGVNRTAIYLLAGSLDTFQVNYTDESGNPFDNMLIKVKNDGTYYFLDKETKKKVGNTILKERIQLEKIKPCDCSTCLEEMIDDGGNVVRAMKILLIPSSFELIHAACLKKWVEGNSKPSSPESRTPLNTFENSAFLASQYKHKTPAWVKKLKPKAIGKFYSGRALYPQDIKPGAKLLGATLTQTDLAKTDLSAADLRAANLTEANLTEANLTEANLQFANLMLADLTGANLDGADLRGATFILTTLPSQLPGNVIIGTQSNGELIRLEDIKANANLTNANLRGAQLNDLDLTGADLSHANLTKTNLRKTTLSGANLMGASIEPIWLTAEQLDPMPLVNTLSDSKKALLKPLTNYASKRSTHKIFGLFPHLAQPIKQLIFINALVRMVSKLPELSEINPVAVREEIEKIELFISECKTNNAYRETILYRGPTISQYLPQFESKLRELKTNFCAESQNAPKPEPVCNLVNPSAT